ncbi:putative ribonuclease H-like domain-containing protein [Tanacetum coccineum]
MYFYSSQNSGQGERECIDTLSCLSYGAHERGRNHSTKNESIFSTQPKDPNVSDAQAAPNLIPEVSNTYSSLVFEPIETTNKTSGQGESIQEQEMFSTQNDTNVKQNEHMKEQVNFPTQEDTSGRYVLPPRANWGVLPKIYSPEKVSRGSRYPIANIAKGNLSEEDKAFALSMYSDEIPANTKQALKSKLWKDAMEEEIKALIKNNTWEKRVLTTGKKTVGCRVLISIAANKGWPLHQFDVKNDFLHGELKEEIYMEAPRGFTESFGEREKKYVLDLLAEIGMADCKLADTPMIVNRKLYMEKKARLADKGRYQRMVGKLIYLLHTPTHNRTCCGSGYGVLFKQNGHLEIQLYTDADWARDKGDQRSTSGYLTLVGVNLVT